MEDITIVDIARLAGVSVSTVSRVMNNHPDVSARTREKVRAVIDRHTYIPNQSARNMRRESMKAVGVVIKGLQNPFFTSMLGPIQQRLDDERYLMILHQVETGQDEVAAAISLCKEKKPRGLIFMGGNFRHSSDKLAMLDVPYVMLTITMNEGVAKDAFSSVTIDDYRAAYTVTEALCRHGHKKLAVIGSNADDISIGRLRVDGFLQALRDNGAYDGEEQVAYAGRFSHAAGYEAAKQLLARAEFTCLLCISDIIAIGAIRAIHDAGLRVPQDISVVGFDGIEEGRYSIPSLATVKQPAEQMAQQSVAIMMDILRRGAAHRHVLCEAHFLEGESFAPPGG